MLLCHISLKKIRQSKLHMYQKEKIYSTNK